MASCCLDRGIRRQDREDTGMVQGKITDGDVTELVRITWQLVHRHADPLVHAKSMEHMAVLARGDS